VLRLQVVTKLEEQQLDLPVGVGDVMGPTQMPDSVRSPNAFRELMDGSRKVDVDLLVSPELAEAIELARRVGTLEGARLPDEDVEGVDENGVNQQTLKTLRELAAEQPAAKDE